MYYYQATNPALKDSEYAESNGHCHGQTAGIAVDSDDFMGKMRLPYGFCSGVRQSHLDCR